VVPVSSERSRAAAAGGAWGPTDGCMGVANEDALRSRGSEVRIFLGALAFDGRRDVLPT
jgi:hypothetical protein